MIDNTKTNKVDFDPAINMARQSLYRFAALSLLDPQAGSWEQLNALRGGTVVEQAAALIGSLPEAIVENIGLGERPLADLNPERVFERLPDSRQALNADYESTFGLLVSNACPPYETDYIDGKLTFQRSHAMADISGFYRAFGLTTSDQHPERPDHVVLELEFMAFLLALERRAAEGDSQQRDERLQMCRDAQSRFLTEHLAWWAPAFAKLLSREDRGGIYEAAGIFLSAHIPAERALLGVSVVSQPAVPTPLERPEACDGCELVV